MNYLVSGKTPKRMGNQHPNLAPYAVVIVADGHLIIAPGNDSQFARLAAVLGHPEWAQDNRFKSNADRLANRDLLMALINGRTATFAKAELSAKLEAAQVPAGPINTIPEVFTDPQVVARAMRGDLPCAEAASGTIPTLRSPYVIDGTAQVSLRHAPRLGQHQVELLADPNWGGEE
jgi:crotonobetainyl-CoA:carnitine CoA-transferase CaiB-like acyl-CoA transferase